MDPMDVGIDSTVLLEAEIETLMLRLIDTDPDAILRLEHLLARAKGRVVVEKNLH